MPEPIKVRNGDLLAFDKPAMLIECCKCGMNHLVVLCEREGIPYLKFYVDEYETEQSA